MGGTSFRNIKHRDISSLGVFFGLFLGGWKDDDECGGEGFAKPKKISFQGPTKKATKDRLPK